MIQWCRTGTFEVKRETDVSRTVTHAISWTTFATYTCSGTGYGRDTYRVAEITYTTIKLGAFTFGSDHNVTIMAVGIGW